MKPQNYNTLLTGGRQLVDEKTGAPPIFKVEYQIAPYMGFEGGSKTVNMGVPGICPFDAPPVPLVFYGC